MAVAMLDGVERISSLLGVDAEVLSAAAAADDEMLLTDVP